jgi:transposase-like protein
VKKRVVHQRAVGSDRLSRCLPPSPHAVSLLRSSQSSQARPDGHQRFLCPSGKHSFSETFDTLYDCRQVNPEQVQLVLQSHSEGCSLRGISRLTGLAYNTVVSILPSASTGAQLIQNQEVQHVEVETVSGDEMCSFVEKNRSNVYPRGSK